MHLQFFIFIGYITWLAAGKNASNSKLSRLNFLSEAYASVPLKQAMSKTWAEGLRAGISKRARQRSEKHASMTIYITAVINHTRPSAEKRLDKT